MNNYSVYQHINKVNGKRYIGITKQVPENRWGANGNNYKSTPYFYNSIKKYGWESFEHIIIKDNLTKEDACALEIELIKKYKTQDKKYGYNILSGGTAPNLTDEVKKKISKALLNNKNGLGHPCSEEKRNKISNAQKNRQFTREHKQKLSKAAKNRHVPCSEQKRQVLSNNYPNKKRVYCQETDTVYESVQSCARELGLYATNVTKVCKGIHKTTGNYHLYYF